MSIQAKTQLLTMGIVIEVREPEIPDQQSRAMNAHCSLFLTSAQA